MENVAIQITAKDNTAGAFKTVEGRLSGLSKNASGVGDTIGAMLGKFNALGLAVGTALSFVSLKSAIDTADAFSKMGQKTGVAVEQLRELNFAAALSDVSTEALGTGLRKLSVNMAAAAGGGKEQAEIFKALGLSVKDASGNLKGADTMLKEVAGQFANFKDGPEKAALAIQLFGKSGADLIPLLNAGSSGLSEMAQEARDLGAVFSGELGKQAEAFNDNLTRIGIASQRTGYAIAAEVLPSLNSLAEAFIAAQKSGNGFGTTIGSVLRTGLEAVVIFVSDVAFVIKGVGTEIGGIIAQLNALGEGGGIFSAKGRAAWNAVGQAMREDAAKARAELDKFQYDLLNAGILTSKAGAGRGTGTDPRLLGDTQTTAPIIKAAAAATAAQISDYEKLTRAIAEKTAIAKLDLITTEKLTEGQKMAERFQSDLTLSTLKMTDAEIKSTRAKLAGLIVDEQAIIAKDKATKRMVAEYEAEQQTEKELSDARAANDNARAAGISTVSAYADAIAEQNTYSQLELSLMGSSAVAREIALGQYRIELDLKKQIDAIDANPSFDDDQRIIQRARARTAAAQATAGVEAKATADEWKRTTDTINSTLTDALMRGFESGKDFAKNLRDTVVNMFKTMVLRPVISAVMSPVAGAITGGLGLSGAAQAGQTVSTGSSLLSGAGTLAGGASAFGGSFAAGAALGTEAFGAGVTMMTNATGLTSFMSGAGQALGAIGPVGWAAIAALAVVALASGGETRSGAKYGVGADGKATKLEGPSGGEIASTQVRGMFDAAKSSIEGMLTGLGSKAVLTGYTAALESSDNGKGFAYATGQINGKAFGDTNTFMNMRGDKTAEQAIKDYQLNLSQSILEALQVTEDIPATIANFITQGLNGGEVKGLSQEAATSLIAGVQVITDSVNAFNARLQLMPFESLKNLSFDAAAGLIAAAGGFEKLDANLTGYYQNFYTADEQRAQSIKNTEAAFAALGKTMPVLDASARDVYRSLVEEAAAKDLSVEANAKAYASLLALQGPMNELAPAFDTAKTAVTELIDTITEGLTQAGQDLAIELLKAQGKTSQALAAQRAKDTAGYTTAQVALYDYNQALRDQITAANEATAAQQAFNTTRLSLQQQYDDLTLTQAQQRNAQLTALNAQDPTGTLSDLQSSVWSLGDAAAKTAKDLSDAAAAKQALDSTLASLQKQYDDLTLTQAQKRNAQLTALLAQDAGGTLSALQVQVWNLSDAADTAAKSVADAAAATQDAAAAAKALASTNKSYQDQLDVLLGTQTDRSIALRDAVDASTRSLMEQVYAQQDLNTATAAAAATALEAAATEKQRQQAVRDTNASLRDQIAVLKGDITERGIALREAGDAETRALLSTLQAQEDLNAARAEEKTRIDALNATNQGWMDQLRVLTGLETERGIALRDASEATTQALMKMVYAQQDLKAASQAATDALAAQNAEIASSVAALTGTLNTAVIDIAKELGMQEQALATARSLAIEKMTAQEIAIYDNIQATNAYLDTLRQSNQVLSGLKTTTASLWEQFNALNPDRAAYRAASIASYDTPQQQAQAKINFALQDAIEAYNNFATDFANATQRLTDNIKNMVQIGTSIKDFVDSLGTSGQGPSLSQARAQYQTTLSFAQGGDLDSYSKITGTAQTLITALTAQASSAQQRDLGIARIKAELMGLKPVVDLDSNNAYLKSIAAATSNLDKTGISLDASADLAAKFGDIRDATKGTEADIGASVQADTLAQSNLRIYQTTSLTYLSGMEKHLEIMAGQSKAQAELNEKDRQAKLKATQGEAIAKEASAYTVQKAGLVTELQTALNTKLTTVESDKTTGFRLRSKSALATTLSDLLGNQLDLNSTYFSTTWLNPDEAVKETNYVDPNRIQSLYSIGSPRAVIPGFDAVAKLAGFDTPVYGENENNIPYVNKKLEELRKKYKDLTGQTAAFASGGTFTNGIVTRPTNFNLGQMGEAGPEAIMPLANINGSLGVRFAGNSSNDALVAEIRRLNESNERLEKRLASIEAYAGSSATSNALTADSTRRMDKNGVLVYTDPAEPLKTEAVA